MDFIGAISLIPEEIVKRLLIPGHVADAKKDTILLTGGGSGLGSYLTALLSQAKFQVIVLDVDLPPYPYRFPGVTYYTCDVSKQQEVEKVSREIKEKEGSITILINNAAITRSNTVEALSLQDIDDVLRVNLFAHFVTIKTFLPNMIQRKRGYIVSIASVLGYISPAKQSVYAASKAGVVSLHEALFHELHQAGLSSMIKCLMISPGQLRTRLFTRVETPSNLIAPVLDPLDVAQAIFEALSRGKEGEISLPLYTNIIPLMRVAPTFLAELARRASGIDNATKI